MSPADVLAENEALSRVALRGAERRPLEDRVAVRYPRLARRMGAWLTPMILRMPHRWRLRRWLLGWSAWRSVNAFKRGDLELMRVIWHPDCEWDYSRFGGWVAADVYRGHQGLAEFISEWGENFQEGGWADALSIEQFDRHVLLVSQRLRGVGRSSGALVEMDSFAVAQLRDGLIWRYEHFADIAESRAAAERLAAERG
jgi:ketosteroid isomerase-like protein